MLGQEKLRELDEKERMARAFEQGVSTDHFENSKMLITSFPDIMRLQKTKFKRIRDNSHVVKTMEQALLRHEKELESEANTKNLQM